MKKANPCDSLNDPREIYLFVLCVVYFSFCFKKKENKLPPEDLGHPLTSKKTRSWSNTKKKAKKKSWIINGPSLIIQYGLIGATPDSWAACYTTMD